jgi:beta-galactosidase
VLRLLPEVQAPKPGELVLVRLQYTDAAGIWKPMERHTLTAEVENGQLVAVGCANPYHAGKLTGNRTDTYFGDALAVIRAGQPGKILIRVTDEEKTYTAEFLCRDR